MNETQKSDSTYDIETGDKSCKKDLTLNKCPKYLGSCRCFLYIKNNPIIVIGPHCMLYSAWIPNLIAIFNTLYEMIIFIYLSNKNGIIPSWVCWIFFLLQQTFVYHTLYFNPGIPYRNIVKLDNTQKEESNNYIPLL